MDSTNIRECKYTYKLEKGDMWRYRMLMQYSSLAGVVQVIFMISMVILIVTKWSSSESFFQVVMIFACLLFPVFQPLAFYGQCINEYDPYKPEHTISFDNFGMNVVVHSHVQSFKYDSIKAVYNRPGMILIQPDDIHLYIIPSRVLGNDKPALAKFLKEQIN